MTLSRETGTSVFRIFCIGSSWQDVLFRLVTSRPTSSAGWMSHPIRWLPLTAPIVHCCDRRWHVVISPLVFVEHRAGFTDAQSGTIKGEWVNDYCSSVWQVFFHVALSLVAIGPFANPVIDRRSADVPFVAAAYRLLHRPQILGLGSRGFPHVGQQPSSFLSTRSSSPPHRHRFTL